MNDYPEPTPWNGDDDRDFGGVRPGRRRCERCGCLTAGFLRMTPTGHGDPLLTCEDCALDLVRDVERQARKGAA